MARSAVSQGRRPWVMRGQARERVLANLPPARIDVLGHEAR